MSNILEQANNIINNRSEEKERQYGPMGEGFERAAMIASGMSGKEWTAHDMFIAMVALKFSRQSYNFKEDNLLDAVAYIGAWQNYIDENKPDHSGPDTHQEVSSRRDLLVEERQNKEENTSDQEAAEPVASSPYSDPFEMPSPRSLINALTKLGEQS